MGDVGRLLAFVLLLSSPALAETVQQRTDERHVAIGTVVGHVLPDGTAYAVRGTEVLPLLPRDIMITAHRATLRLPDQLLICPLPPEALDERRGVLHERTGLTLRVSDRFRVQTWVTACPDGPGVIWQATDHTTITTKARD